MRILTLLLVLAGCAAVDGSAQEDLARELAGRPAGAAQNCVSANQSQSLQAVDRSTIVLRAADAIWVSRLRAACPGLRPMSTIIVESFTGQYCRGDRFRAIEAGSSSPGLTCVLAEFVPYRAPR
jgi:hypothetical protein